MISYHPATIDNRLAIAQVHVRSWQVGYRGLMPDDYLDQLKPEDRANRYTFGDGRSSGPRWTVAAEDGMVVGFVSFGTSRDEDTPDHGEVYGLYVDPDHWHRGVGRSLMDNAESDFLQTGFSVANLWVLVGNSRATDFYERGAWSPDGTSRVEEVWGLEVSSIRYQRSLSQN
jgi:ribosomal protein S18 acetylase RimI-like enzyme